MRSDRDTAPAGFRSLAGTRAFLRLIAALCCLLVLSPKPAVACAGLCDTEFNSVQIGIIEAYINIKHLETQAVVNAYMDWEFAQLRIWMFEVYFKQYLGNAMMQMAQQLSAVALQQMEILGTFLDAKNQLETERLYGQLTAEAMKDYHPSEGMCSIGTAARNLPGAERDGDMTALVLSHRSLARQLMNANSIGAEGQASDDKSRVAQFVKTYCDKNDSKKALTAICDKAVPDARKNKDVDFTRTLWDPLTLDVNFSDSTKTDDEEDLIALQTNLYANDLFTRPLSAAMLKFNSASPETSNAKLEGLLAMRAIAAKHAVAENSFAAIAGMKAAGSPDATAKYLQAAAKQLNPAFTDAEAAQYIGKNPSYYAQMEILTKKLIETPQFFTDLYEQPANVARKGVAIEAIGLIQDRDDFESTLRSESMLSLLLEMKLKDEQDTVQNNVDRLTEK